MKKLSILTLTLLLGACSTPYKSEGFAGGFSEIQLDKNVWQVTFEGNGYTKSQRSEELAMLRSAELTLSQNFTHFAFVDSRSSSETVTISTPQNSYSTFNANTYGNSTYGTMSTRSYGGGTQSFNKPKTTNTVMMFNGKPTLNTLVYDAKLICENIGKKYEVICNEVKK